MVRSHWLICAAVRRAPDRLTSRRMAPVMLADCRIACSRIALDQFTCQARDPAREHERGLGGLGAQPGGRCAGPGRREAQGSAPYLVSREPGARRKRVAWELGMGKEARRREAKARWGGAARDEASETSGCERCNPKIYWTDHGLQTWTTYLDPNTWTPLAAPSRDASRGPTQQHWCRECRQRQGRWGGWGAGRGEEAGLPWCSWRR